MESTDYLDRGVQRYYFCHYLMSRLQVAVDVEYTIMNEL